MHSPSESFTLNAIRLFDRSVNGIHWMPFAGCLSLNAVSRYSLNTITGYQWLLGTARDYQWRSIAKRPSNGIRCIHSVDPFGTSVRYIHSECERTIVCKFSAVNHRTQQWYSWSESYVLHLVCLSHFLFSFWPLQLALFSYHLPFGCLEDPERHLSDPLRLCY